MKIFWILLIIFIIYVVIQIIVDSNRFVVRHYVVTSDRLKEDHRIAFLSDLHNKVYGKRNAPLIRAIEEEKPDVCLLGGDILTAYPGRDFRPALSFVKEMKDRFPLVYAMGNHEYRLRLYPDVYGTMFEDYEKEMKALGIEFLDNACTDLFEDVTVYGLSMEKIYYRRFIHARMEDDYVASMLGNNKREKFSILLAHDPDYFKAYAKWEPDLVLSGHLHGGVARIPGWRGVISPMWRLFPKYAGGKFTKDQSTMIVSRGLGMHTIPLRLWNPAEIVIVDLKKA